MTEPLVRRLVDVVGPAHVLVGPEMTAGYETDWTGRWRGHARLVVRPADTAQVSAVLLVCGDEGAAVVPQGGNTGLVGGSVPGRGEVVLSTIRLAAVGPVDTVAAQVTVGAGATLAAVQAAARSAGLDVGVDLAARDSATIGGMVATNAGGVHVLRHGPMRAQVIGVEAVLADGSVITRLSGLVKDNVGYDLPGLLCGSEGTLGVVTRVVLRLVPRSPHRVTALLGVGGTAQALAVLGRLRAALPSLEAAEVMYADGLDIVCAHTDMPAPLRAVAPCMLLVECGGPVDAVEDLAAAVGGCPEVTDSAVATDDTARAALWAYRERHTEAINAIGVPHKLDVTLPLGHLAAFAADVRGLVAEVAPGSTCVLFGHLGDGNLHVNVVGPPADDDGVDDAVVRLVVAAGGSISAEHGIGMAKRRWLPLARSPADIAAMRAVKAALDPTGLLNPAVIFPS